LYLYTYIAVTNSTYSPIFVH